MKLEEDKIKEVFSSKLKKLEVTPPPAIWDEIDSDLSAIQSNKPTKRNLFFTYSGIAAAIIIALLLILPNKRESRIFVATLSEISPIIYNNNTHKSIGKDHSNQNPRDLQTNAIKPVNSRTKHKNKKSINTLILEDNLLNKSRAYQSSNISTDSSQRDKANTTLPPTEELNTSKPSTQNLEDQIAQFIADGEKSNTIFAQNTNQETPSKFQLGLSGGSGFYRSSQMKTQLRLSEIEIDSNGEIKNGLEKQRMKLDHNQPITFGINISKRLNRKLSLETAVTYTYLSSKIKTAEKKNTTKDIQKLHYIGVPLSLNYKFAEWQKVNFFLSTGLALQKDFYGRLRTDQYGEDHTTIHISQKHPQFSTNASFEISYPIYKKLSLYGKFGTAYYFDANNDYETIYSDKKWIFNLNLGIKFGL